MFAEEILVDQLYWVLWWPDSPLVYSERVGSHLVPHWVAEVSGDEADFLVPLLSHLEICRTQTPLSTEEGWLFL